MLFALETKTAYVRFANVVGSLIQTGRSGFRWLWWAGVGREIPWDWRVCSNQQVFCVCALRFRPKGQKKALWV